MRKITQAILNLNLFKPLRVEPMQPNPRLAHMDWEEPDRIVLYEDEDVSFCIDIKFSDPESVNVYLLEVTRLDLHHGDVYDSENIWEIEGAEEDLIQFVKSIAWIISDSHLLKSKNIYTASNSGYGNI